MRLGLLYRVSGIERYGLDGWEPWSNGWDKVLYVRVASDTFLSQGTGGPPGVILYDSDTGRWEIRDYMTSALVGWADGQPTDDVADLAWFNDGTSYTWSTLTLTKVCVAITDANELQAVGASPFTLEGDYMQTGDIELSSLANFNPIGNASYPFFGSYDGQGYTLNNLTINRSTTDHVGLFGRIGAWGHGHLPRLIRNVHLRNCTIAGRNEVGALTGILDGNGRVLNCSATGSITGQLRLGGLIGSMVTGRAERSWADVTVTASGSDRNRIGGFAADIRYDSVVRDCYARGRVTGGSGGNGVGGFAGFITETPVIQRCYAAGLATGSHDVGQFAGWQHEGANPTVEHCYWVSDDADSTSVHGLRLDTTEAKDPDNYTNWNFNTRWNINPTETINNGYPYLDPRKAPASAYPGLFRSLYQKR